MAATARWTGGIGLRAAVAVPRLFALCAALLRGGPQPRSSRRCRSAEELYQGQKTMLRGPHAVLGRRHHATTRPRSKASRTSSTTTRTASYAVLAELAIADAYFDEREVRRGALLLPRLRRAAPASTSRCPTRCYQAAMCHYNAEPRRERDQTATRDALDSLDRLLAPLPALAVRARRRGALARAAHAPRRARDADRRLLLRSRASTRRPPSATARC